MSIASIIAITVWYAWMLIIFAIARKQYMRIIFFEITLLCAMIIMLVMQLEVIVVMYFGYSFHVIASGILMEADT